MAAPQRLQQQQGQQWRQRVRLAAGRGGGPDRDSDSDSEDFFMTQEGNSIDEAYYEEEAMSMEEDDDSMRLYLDSANVQEWAKWAETGVFFGFTTNPTILKRDGVPCNIASMRHLAREAFQLEVEELQLQAWGTTAAEMYSCGMDLMDVDTRIVVKLPITLEGAKAAKRLVADGVPVTMTGIYASHQVVTSLAMGAAYAAPYVGRMSDAGKNGIEETIRMQEIVDLGSGSDPLQPMRLLVASIRSADEIATLAAKGCNTFTIAPYVAEQLFNVELTNQAAELFQEHADDMGAMRGH
ncbi:Transaldolase [Chlorella sorokiniana]|uniref:Transaldolase n=1 Tax=Chlorella sorokiniana TaxID=3076 RepID=A0A2P6TS76_CHLSO|nr:Transaldolase [Chlorella sorokiniana]|eukprot:PRW56906.1 Transaldolase [Chlorella sorokiniana]